MAALLVGASPSVARASKTPQKSQHADDDDRR